ncbi:mannosyl-3-phosphoglycerate phosphatase-related protein [Superficieibacter electus]|uniref:Mannosyl-3-phosphoglycerate phosphatase-related protein n=1 Tax=Superficieibacter electus TaxID=2022662 RepID=A0A2P5GVM4_9ENTR|nr:mannosyl-3-phosphoglycerate phosphatase-related protein [Superficieibacter electus]POP47598.1 mannosyl-3-phosphoglycerate phosphatase-related protein [Superficieibacter electus]POP50609.1 mannosyl-3-phosphoglycerate phosphatase-related protein [Superficieibacter electus]
MPDLREPLLVFTDLEGTLLESHTWDWQPAAPWLDRLKEAGIPVILCSSKTSAEMLQIQKELNLEGLPFIAENGAVIQLDAHWQDEAHFPRLIAGSPQQEIIRILNQLREKEGFKFTTFSDVDEQVISDWTGLNNVHATLARQQEASETLIWRDSDERMADFAATLTSLGMHFVQGARFWHVHDRSADKAQAVSFLLNLYQQREGKRRTTLGLGDGPNDAPLLDVVDYAVVVKGLTRDGIKLQRNDPQRVYHTAQEGPAGWSEGMAHFFPSHHPAQ